MQLIAVATREPLHALVWIPKNPANPAVLANFDLAQRDILRFVGRGIRFTPRRTWGPFIEDTRSVVHCGGVEPVYEIVQLIGQDVQEPVQPPDKNPQRNVVGGFGNLEENRWVN